VAGHLDSVPAFQEVFMPRPRLTDEEITAMRERILDAAIHILQEEGPAGLSIRAIAERVGVSHMVLYTYFENRDALLTALHDKHHQLMQARHADTLARARSGDIVAVTREVLEGYMSFARSNPRISRFFWRMLLSGTGNKPHHPPHTGILEETRHLADLVAIGIEREVFVEREPLIGALVVSGMINGSQVMTLLPGMFDDYTLDRVTDEMVDAAMGYLTGQKG
jgi:AcrR family transcriptional regulator